MDYAEFDNSNLDDGQQEGGGGFFKYCLLCGCLVALMIALAGAGTAWWFKQHMIVGDVATRSNLANTLDCEIPAGLEGIFGFSANGVRASIFGPPGVQGGAVAPLMLVVVELPPGADSDKVKRDLGSKLNQGGGNVEKEEPIKLTIRGQEVEAQRSISQGGNGQKVRQVFCLIDKGPDDPTQVMLWFMGDDATFDQEALDGFLKSIK